MVTGIRGQLALALNEVLCPLPDVDCILVGRPKLDLERLDTVERIVRDTQPDVIVSAAAYTDVNQAEVESQRAMRVNGEAPGRLAHAAKKNGARFIHISTDYVFDGTKSRPYVETDEVAPANAYGRSKLLGEFEALSENPDALILRTSWLYSPFGRNFVTTILSRMGNREQLTIVNDQEGCPTSALDVAAAISQLVGRWASEPSMGLGQCYHCSGSGSATWYELAREVAVASGAGTSQMARISATSTRVFPTRAVRPKNSRLDCSKLLKDFDLQLPDWRVSLDRIVQRLMIEYDLRRARG